MAQASSGNGSTSAHPRRRRRWARGVSVVLALGAVLGVGAAAYSRGLDDDGAATPAANVGPLLAAPADMATPATPEVAPPAAKPARPAEAASREPAKVKIGALRMTYDASGLPRTSLPITVTNNGPITRSFDVTVVAKSPSGTKITTDTGTAANLRPGQSAQLQILELVNDKLVDQLRTATFEVGDVFAY
ncbi:MAG: hypothetical protein ACT4QG_00295 [Sporichthyaceae bacterium]